jgi:hypothetical protein
LGISYVFATIYIYWLIIYYKILYYIIL